MSNPIPRVRLPKGLAFAVGFALWCQREKVEPAEAAQLVALARRAFAAGERHASTGTDRAKAGEERTAAALGAKAAALGFGVQWPGLWPELTRGGEFISLPTE